MPYITQERRQDIYLSGANLVMSSTSSAYSIGRTSDSKSCRTKKYVRI